MSLKKINQIVEGWRNKIIPPEKLRDVIEEVSKERNIICMNCEYHSRFHNTLRIDDHCTKCGCPLFSKTRCLSCECPLKVPKWESIDVNTEDTNL